ncbi:MAG TPA: helix-turn-helix transcriptional regulator [Nitrospirota bacterium]|nr:helix-turn-helix transcriptional regulator [Nitrospirota bacterium]
MVENHGRDRAALTPREIDVLTWVKHGRNTSEIASILEISERTVKFHISNIIRKLNAENRVHALVIAIEQKLLS